MAALVLAPAVGAAACTNDFDQFSVAGTGGTTASSTSTSSSTSSNGGGGSGATGGGGGSPGGCGDGVLGGTESCDDGDTVAGDGCSGSCTTEGQPNQCPTGVGIDLSPPGIWLTDSTAGQNDVTRGSCGGNSAPDLAYELTPSQSGTVHIDLVPAGNFDPVLVVRGVCQFVGGSTDPFCSDANFTATYPAVAGQPFHVIVSGFQGDSGAFTLHVYY
ncbi:MAG: hypothetical protein IT373_16940 [Polyangiaceae bacterium]|nr:hypothetical protein [Polyangiaceae bacterium]